MLNVAIVAGGDSGEYEISIKSGKQVELHMDRDKFAPYLVVVRGKSWNYRIGLKKFPIDKNDFSLTIGRRKIRFDAVFVAIHGTPGENGRLQGYFEMLGIPYTSCDVTTSALTFNKSFWKFNTAVKPINTRIVVKARTMICSSSVKPGNLFLCNCSFFNWRVFF